MSLPELAKPSDTDPGLSSMRAEHSVRETQRSVMGCCFLEFPESIDLDLVERYMETFYVEALPIFWNECSACPHEGAPGRI